MSVYQLLVSFEKRGHLDLKLTGHQCERPPEVQRGERSDAINVTQVEHSVFKPNAVLPAKAKGTNIAGVIGVKCLAASEFLVLLWRSLGCDLICFIGVSEPSSLGHSNGFSVFQDFLPTGPFPFQRHPPLFT